MTTAEAEQKSPFKKLSVNLDMFLCVCLFFYILDISRQVTESINSVLASNMYNCKKQQQHTCHIYSAWPTFTLAQPISSALTSDWKKGHNKRMCLLVHRETGAAILSTDHLILNPHSRCGSVCGCVSNRWGMPLGNCRVGVRNAAGDGTCRF